jgi:hypothetical protein
MRLATLMLALALAAGCGEGDEQPAAPAPSGSLTELTVTVDPDGEGAKRPRETTVRCEAPEDSDVCRAIARLQPAAFEPTPGNVACTQQYGGPQTATVTGTLRGEPVDATFSLVNGCEISRWRDVAPVLDAAR